MSRCCTELRLIYHQVTSPTFLCGVFFGKLNLSDAHWETLAANSTHSPFFLVQSPQSSSTARVGTEI